MGCSVATLCVSLPIWGAGRVVLHKWGCFYLLIMPSLSCLLFACVWCREHLPAFAYLWGKRVEVRKTKFRRFLKLDAMICVTGICVLLIEPTRPAWFVVPGSISTFMLSEKTIADTTFLCVFFTYIGSWQRVCKFRNQQVAGQCLKTRMSCFVLWASSIYQPYAAFPWRAKKVWI